VVIATVDARGLMRHYKVSLLTATACMGIALWCSAAALGQNAPSQNGTVQNGTAQKAAVPNASVQKAGQGSINGPWTVTFTIQGQTVSGQMSFQTEGEKLGGSVETEHTGHGTLNGGAWSHNKLSGIYVFESHEAIAIAGEFRDGKLAGVFRTEGLDGKWEAVPAGVQP
jgi:hypothetical protein